jgi:hypothetical protein
VDDDEGGGWGVKPGVDEDDATPAEFTYTE